MKIKNKLRCLSLFSGGGVAEALLSKIGVEVLIANEIIQSRSKFYQYLYPNVKMFNDDITNPEVKTKIINDSKSLDIDLLIATPPCQGMSIHGKMIKDDPRNQLVSHAVELIKLIKPKFVLIENVPRQLSTKINYKGQSILIPKYLNISLQNLYNIYEDSIFNSEDYSVPQTRSRSIFRMVRKDIDIEWTRPKKSKIINLSDILSDIPSLDPEIKETEKSGFFKDFEKKKEIGLNFSKWHFPSKHCWRHIEWMMHTPSGMSAFSNEIFFPKKDDNTKIKGRNTSYKRFKWDRPAYTITQNNGVISSSVCVHPGRPIKISKNENLRLYSDPRVLSIYELMLVSSIPTNWNIPDWANENEIRKIIGEGIPPLLIMKIINELI